MSLDVSLNLTDFLTTYTKPTIFNACLTFHTWCRVLHWD